MDDKIPESSVWRWRGMGLDAFLKGKGKYPSLKARRGKIKNLGQKFPGNWRKSNFTVSVSTGIIKYTKDVGNVKRSGLPIYPNLSEERQESKLTPDSPGICPLAKTN